MNEIDKIIQAIDSVLKDNPEMLLLDEWKERKTENDHYTFGNCYVASEVLYRLSKEIENGPHLKLCKANVRGVNHYWLIDKQTGKIYDITHHQFLHGQFFGEVGEKLLLDLYANGKGTSLQNTSNRAKRMIELVREKMKTR